MASEQQAVFVSTQALWAGDPATADKELRKLIARKDYRRDRVEFEGPAEFLKNVAGYRQWQITAAKGRRTRFATANKLRIAEVEPLIIESRMLRGVISQLSPREVELRAYLKESDTSNVSVLRYNAHLRARAGDKTEAESKTAVWDEPGPIFIRVVVTSLCQVEARALWTGDQPSAPLEVRQRFQSLLDALGKEPPIRDRERTRRRE